MKTSRETPRCNKFNENSYTKAHFFQLSLNHMGIKSMNHRQGDGGITHVGIPALRLQKETTSVSFPIFYRNSIFESNTAENIFQSNNR